MSRSQFHSINLFILTHAWLNLWDERMTTGRINQVAIIYPTHVTQVGSQFRANTIDNPTPAHPLRKQQGQTQAFSIECISLMLEFSNYVLCVDKHQNVDIVKSVVLRSSLKFYFRQFSQQQLFYEALLSLHFSPMFLRTTFLFFRRAFSTHL